MTYLELSDEEVICQPFLPSSRASIDKHLHGSLLSIFKQQLYFIKLYTYKELKFINVLCKFIKIE